MDLQKGHVHEEEKKKKKREKRHKTRGIRYWTKARISLLAEIYKWASSLSMRGA